MRPLVIDLDPAGRPFDRGVGVGPKAGSPRAAGVGADGTARAAAGFPIERRSSRCLAKLATELPPATAALRAEVGRLPGDRLPRRDRIYTRAATSGATGISPKLEAEFRANLPRAAWSTARS